MANNKDNKILGIDVNVEEEPVELSNQRSNESDTDELKQQAGELFKAAGGLAGSFGKLAMKKGSELKDKISDEEFQSKAKENVKALRAKATEHATKAAEKATVLAETATKSIEEKAGANKLNEDFAELADEKKESQQSPVEQKPNDRSRNVKLETSATSQKTVKEPKNNKPLIIALVIVAFVVIGITAILSGGNKEEAVSEEPGVEETTNETATTEASATEETEAPNAVYYSSNTEDTVRNGNTGVYSYKTHGESYDQYYIIDFDEGYVYYFTDGNGEESCERLKIDSGDLNEVLIITFHDGGDEWSYGLHFKYKENPEHLVVQDNDGFENDYSPTDLSNALVIKEGKTVKDY